MKRKLASIPEYIMAVNRQVSVTEDALGFVVRCLTQKFHFKETQLFHYLDGEVRELWELDTYTIYLPYEMPEGQEQFLQQLQEHFVDEEHWLGVHVQHRSREARTSPLDIVQVGGRQLMVPFTEPNPMRTNVIFFKEKNK